jgi:uncharacterized protein YebE (UPF0316 family)
VFENFDFFNWVILPVLIFLSRLCDVSLGTLRHVFISKGYKKIVPVLGFFEVLLWLIVVRQVLNNVNNVICYLAWSGGFATGTYVGMIIEERLALGLQVVRIITNNNYDQLITALRSANHGATVIDGLGAKGSVKIILTVIERKNIDQVINLIMEHNPSAFYSVEDIKETKLGVFAKTSNMSFIRRMFPAGKGK